MAKFLRTAGQQQREVFMLTSREKEIFSCLQNIATPEGSSQGVLVARLCAKLGIGRDAVERALNKFLGLGLVWSEERIFVAPSRSLPKPPTDPSENAWGQEER